MVGLADLATRGQYDHLELVGHYGKQCVNQAFTIKLIVVCLVIFQVCTATPNVFAMSHSEIPVELAFHIFCALSAAMPTIHDSVLQPILQHAYLHAWLD